MKNNTEHRTHGILDRFSNPGKIQLISTKHLHSGLPYQRPVEQAHVNQLIRKWDPKYLTPIRRLSEVDPAEIIQLAHVDRPAMRYARLIRKKYNEQGAKMLPDRFEK